MVYIYTGIISRRWLIKLDPIGIIFWLIPVIFYNHHAGLMIRINGVLYFKKLNFLGCFTLVADKLKNSTEILRTKLGHQVHFPVCNEFSK